MAKQLISPVKWHGIIQKMVSSGVDTFVEVGPKKVLTGLVRKILPRETEAKIYNIGDIQSLEDFLKAVAWVQLQWVGISWFEKPLLVTYVTKGVNLS